MLALVNNLIKIYGPWILGIGAVSLAFRLRSWLIADYFIVRYHESALETVLLLDESTIIIVYHEINITWYRETSFPKAAPQTIPKNFK
jgi:hypothetical protein